MNKNGFTLIELMIVVAIIAVIAAIAIPNLISARRVTNEGAAVQQLNSFYKAASLFSEDRPTNYLWESVTTDFTPFFNFVTPKAGYNFFYFSNDVVADGNHQGTKYVHLGVPVSISTGQFAVYCDESHSIYTTQLLTDAQITAMNAAAQGNINFALDSGRPVFAGIVWSKK